MILRTRQPATLRLRRRLDPRRLPRARIRANVPPGCHGARDPTRLAPLTADGVRRCNSGLLPPSEAPRRDVLSPSEFETPQSRLKPSFAGPQKPTTLLVFRTVDLASSQSFVEDLLSSVVVPVLWRCRRANCPNDEDYHQHPEGEHHQPTPESHVLPVPDIDHLDENVPPPRWGR